MDTGEWEEAEGEVEGEIFSTLLSTQRRRKQKLYGWSVLTFVILFVVYVGVYVCEGTLAVTSTQISNELQSVSPQVSSNLLLRAT
jgi:hypothetical protein